MTIDYLDPPVWPQPSRLQSIDDIPVGRDLIMVGAAKLETITPVPRESSAVAAIVDIERAGILSDFHRTKPALLGIGPPSFLAIASTDTAGTDFSKLLFAAGDQDFRDRFAAHYASHPDAVA
jgi:hypothetical protein